jgi:site-specific recombinase XerD
LADRGVDLRTIQEWLGHRSIEMTVRYTRISQRRFNGLGGPDLDPMSPKKLRNIV